MKPTMIDPKLMIAAGMNPKTGLPGKVTGPIESKLKNDIKRALKIRDEQDAINRYKWFNLPCDLSSQELERLLYYKGQLCFFYYEKLDKFFFMPYALNGSIDFYGRFNSIHPIPISNGVTEEEKKSYSTQAAILSTLKLDVKYDVPLREITYDDLINSAVLLGDYTQGLSETIIPRADLNDGIVDTMSECIPMMRTALRNSTGVTGMRVGNQDESSNVIAANQAIDAAVLNGQRYIPVVGNLDFQDLAGDSVSRADDFLMTMQSLDNFRLSLYGIENGGIFDKKAYVNRDQTALNGSNIDSPLDDGLAKRQRFCDIVNGIYRLGISCELNEAAINADMNRDGIMYNELDQSGIPGDN